MKNLRLLAPFAALVMGCSSSGQPFPWSDASFSKVMATAGDKMVMLDFFTDT